METDMKILWVCNIMLPFIAEALGKPASNKEGWLTGLAELLIKNRENAGIELAVCFPASEDEKDMYGETAGVKYYGFYEDTRHEETYDDALEVRMQEIFADYQPDLVHCFGTEFGHTLAAVRAFKRPERTLVGLQGLCAACAKAYMADVPEYVQRRSTLRDILRKDNLLQQQQKFALRGEREKEILKLTGNVTGRTAFDRKEAEKVNPEAVYFFMNETLRSNFYDGAWEAEQCEKHSIFVSQGNYPLKGFHYVLQAMPELLTKYPDCKLYVAGDVITAYTTWKEKLKISSYGKYLLELIRSNHLEQAVVFLGKADAQMMKERYLKSHVFVLSSSLENSPNSLGEAMLLGVPCVAADVGGVPDMLTDGVEGLTYRAGDVESMVSCISHIFEETKLAEQMGKAAAKRARMTHDRDTNYNRLIEIYRTMTEKR